MLNIEGKVMHGSATPPKMEIFLKFCVLLVKFTVHPNIFSAETV